MDLFDLFARIVLDTGDYDKGVDEADGKARSLASAIGDGLKTAAKVGAAALAAGAAAVSALTKVSIEGYAAQEQLIGGVKTLFGTEASSVEEYAASVGKSVDEVQAEYQSLTNAQNSIFAQAQEAWRNVGLSANDYMETVTGFSASLIQSLGGDTERAAAVADTAITDMADNANKMGTAMDSIQNAYQGFAKQNYTMLDNLKLGYGGTKEEMERLIKDANAVKRANGEMANLSIDSFADVVEAIHTIQTEMGITGTTLKEGQKTITGSMAAAKAAISNLLTGLGDDSANLDKLINDAVESVTAAGDNIIPRVEKILVGIGSLIVKLAPVISDRLPELLSQVLPPLVSAGATMVVGLAQGVIAALPDIVTAIVSAVPAVIAALQGAGPQLLAVGQQLLSYLAEGTLQGIPILLEALPTVLVSALQFLAESGPQIIASGLDFVLRLVDGITSGLPDLISALPAIIETFCNFLANNGAAIINAGVDIILALVRGLLQALPTLVSNLPRIGSAIINGLGSILGAVVDIGKNIVFGLGDGIASMASWLMDKVTGFVGSLVRGAKNLLGIHSPSTVFASMGENMALGLGQGWSSEFDKVKHDIVDGMTFEPGAIVADIDARMAPATAAAAPAYGSNTAEGLRPIVVNMTINANEHQNVLELAEAVADILQRTIIQKERAYA